jgi:ferredoxin
MKTHGLTLMTGAVKNLYGTVYGFNKSKYHFPAADPVHFANMLTEILAIVRPALNVMDGIMAMEGAGPAAGVPRFVGALLASPDAVAMDAVAGHLMGYAPGQVLTTRLAAKKGLGEADLSRIEIKGERPENIKPADFARVADISRITRFVPGFLFGLGRRLGRLLRVEPFIEVDRCTRCSLCVQHCPALAMTQKEGQSPVILRNKCIHCFCCSEVCPVQAITVKKNWLARQYPNTK